jgi:hypothetical protein
VLLPAPVGEASGFAALALPPELMARSRPDLRDLRLVGASGRELPYVVQARVERERTTSWQGALADVKREAKRSSVYTVDLGEPRRFDRIQLTIPASGFAKRVQAEVSTDGQRWREVVGDAGVFDRPWTPPVHHTTLALPEPVSARWVRVRLDDRRSRPQDVTAVAVALVASLPGEEWRRAAALLPLTGRSGVSRYRVEAPAGLAFETIRLESDDPAFSRRVSLVESFERDGRRQERTLGSGMLYRLRLPEEDLAGESLALRVAPPEGGERTLEVEDGDSPPLRRPRLEIAGAERRLLFAAEAPLTLYYGNDATHAPHYDLAALRERLESSASLASARLGVEEANPRHRKPTPLAFAALRGAALDVGRWARVRPFSVPGPEDLYTLTLAPPDLGELRRDLGDLRIADEAGHQLPYILEADAAEARAVLEVERDASASPRASRYRLTAPARAGGVAALPLRALELELDAAFFSRGVRVLAPGPGPRERERTLFAGTLARAPGAAGALRIPLDGSPVAALLLEVEEGDNAPLPLQRVAGLVRVPRVVFKATAGRYRLLLGNPEAAPPRYDLAALRREVLSYSAVGLEAGVAEDNAALRRRLWGRLGAQPPGLLLWTALGGAVVALLLLTARILRQQQH